MKINHVVVSGVSGSGKTTLGKILAADLGWRFLDADDYHSPEAIQKMARGTPLKDHDRKQWLEDLNAELRSSRHTVLSCSALKKQHRHALSWNTSLFYIWLDITQELAIERIQNRKNHFMPPSLIKSQFAIATAPRKGLILDASQRPDELLSQCKSVLNR